LLAASFYWNPDECDIYNADRLRRRLVAVDETGRECYMRKDLSAVQEQVVEGDVQWTVTVSKQTDAAVRTFLAQ
jgi:hypothetical protein